MVGQTPLFSSPCKNVLQCLSEDNMRLQQSEWVKWSGYLPKWQRFKSNILLFLLLYKTHKEGISNQEDHSRYLALSKSTVGTNNINDGSILSRSKPCWLTQYETEAAKWNPDIIHYIIYTWAWKKKFCRVLSQTFNQNTMEFVATHKNNEWSYDKII